MNILLISPRFPETFWSFAHALRFIRRRASQPPLGLLTVAALLPNEWQKRLVDLNVTDLTDADLEEANLRNANIQDTIIDPNLALTLSRELRAEKMPL